MLLYLLVQRSMHRLGDKTELALFRGSMFLRKFGLISGLLQPPVGLKFNTSFKKNSYSACMSGTSNKLHVL